MASNQALIAADRNITIQSLHNDPRIAVAFREVELATRRVATNPYGIGAKAIVDAAVKSLDVEFCRNGLLEIDINLTVDCFYREFTTAAKFGIKDDIAIDGDRLHSEK